MLPLLIYVGIFVDQGILFGSITREPRPRFTKLGKKVGFWPVDDPYSFWCRQVKGQGQSDLQYDKMFWSINSEGFGFDQLLVKALA